MHLHFYVEEPSTESALIELVPKILEGKEFEFEIYSFNGKHSLLRKLPNRLKAYTHRQDDCRIIVLLDRDNDDCNELKSRLETMANEARLPTLSTSRSDFRVINRIVIEELEAWFFGDLEAVLAAYPRLDRNLVQQRAFRDPDAIRGGTWESLERILHREHPGGLEKLRAAREITRHMRPERNTSRSFHAFRNALLTMFE